MLDVVKKRRTVSIFCGTVIFAPRVAFAATLLSNPTPGAGATLQDFVYILIDIVQWVAIPMLVLAIIYAGFILVSAGGDPAQITKGKLWVLSTLVGAAIILGARVIADVVFGTASLF
ncbi:MAG: hypothetical protein AAB869_03710 [Patescibacteria group bacterium]